MRKPVQLNLEERFIERLDAACGLVPRSRWVEDKLMSELPPDEEPRSPKPEAESPDPRELPPARPVGRSEMFRGATQR